MAKGSGKRFSPADCAAICARYAAGESSETIGASFGKSGTAIRGVLTRHGVARRDASAAHRGWTLHADAFVDPGPEARYWIGLMLTDGYVLDRDGSPRVGITLTAPDGEVLARLSTFLGCPRAPRRRARRNARDVLIWATRSRRLAEVLAPWGVVPRKSAGVVAPPQLADDPDFWRGVIDGDGTIGSDRRIPAVGITGTEALCTAFAHWAHRLFPAHLGSVQVNNRQSFSITVSGEAAKAVLAVYERPGPAIARKQAAALDALQRWKGRTFRTFDLGVKIDDTAPAPIDAPTLEQARAAFAALRDLQPSQVLRLGRPNFRHYHSPAQCELLVGPPRFNAASQALAVTARMACRHRGWRSPAEVWADPGDRAKILAQTMGYSKVAARSLKRRAYVAASYNVAAATALLKQAGATRVLDPCAGWGDRLVAALACGASYRGYDPSTRMAPVYQQLVDLHGGDARVACAGFLQGPAPEPCDAVLTCPPYWDTEHYGDEADQAGRFATYAQWRDGFYLPMLRRAWDALVLGGSFILTVANVERDGDVLPLVEDALAAMPGTPRMMALMLRGRRGSKHSAKLAEPTMVWRKP